MSASGPSATHSTTAASASLALQEDKDLRSGLMGEYYNVGKKMDKMPDMGGLVGMKPVSRHIDRMIDFGPQGSMKTFSDPALKSSFAVRWTGWVKVPKDGAYTFFLKCTDGSKLWIDGKLVLEHEGKPVMEENHKTMDLKAGKWKEGDTLQRTVPIAVIPRVGVEPYGWEESVPGLTDVDRCHGRQTVVRGDCRLGGRGWLL